RGGTDIPDQVTDRGTGRVIARVTPLRHHPMQVGKADADGGESVVIEPVCDLDRLETGGLVDLVAQVLNFDRRETEQVAQCLDGPFRIVEPFRDHIDAEVRAIRGERRAVAIENPAAPGRNQGEVHPIALRLHLVLLVLGDGDVAHPGREQHADAALHGANHEGAPVETLGEGRGGELLPHAQLIRLTRMRRRRSSWATRRATTGNNTVESTSWGTMTVSCTKEAPDRTEIGRA